MAGAYISGFRVPEIGYHKAAFVVWGDGTASLVLDGDTGGYPVAIVPDGELIDRETVRDFLAKRIMEFPQNERRE